jgi:TRAP-type C4-dicarboxylate transport system substrate-binding protein
VPGAAPLQVKPFEKLGAQPVSMPLGEVLPAMQNRTIDGLIASAAVFTAFKYYDVAKGNDVTPPIISRRGHNGEQRLAEIAGPELEKAVREEAFNAQRKVEKFAIDDAARTADVWKKNGGEVIIFPDAETKAYLTQVESIAPAVLSANPTMKGDFDLLSETAKKLNQ